MYVVTFKNEKDVEQDILSFNELVYFMFYVKFHKNMEIVMIKREPFYD